MSEGRDGQLDRKDDGEGHVEQLQLPPDGRGPPEGVGELVRDLPCVGLVWRPSAASSPKTRESSNQSALIPCSVIRMIRWFIVFYRFA